jgi:hypothetical protein
VRDISTRIRTGKSFREISVKGGFGKVIGRSKQIEYKQSTTNIAEKNMNKQRKKIEKKRRNERTTDGVGSIGIWPKFCSALHYLSYFVLNVCCTQTCTIQSVSCQHNPSVQFADSPQNQDHHPS